MCEPGASLMSLIKHDMRALNSCAESTELYYLSLLISFADKGPHRSENPFSFPGATSFPLPTRFSNRIKPEMEKTPIDYENWQIIYRWKALGEENTLEQFIFNLMHCASLALKRKKTRVWNPIERFGE
jgi:hypothetical protein